MSVLKVDTDSVEERRTYMRAGDRRAQILSCARDVFADNGYHHTSVANICQAAGIGRGTLYQYFSNKRDVFEAVLADLVERVRVVLDQRRPVAVLDGVGQAPAELIVSYCQRRLKVMLEAIFFDEAALRLILREARGLDGGIDALLKKVDEIVLGALIDDLSAATRVGIIDCADVRLTALYVLGGVEKMVLAAVDSDEPVDLDRIVQVATRVELFGLLSDAARNRRAQ